MDDRGPVGRKRYVAFTMVIDAVNGPGEGANGAAPARRDVIDAIRSAALEAGMDPSDEWAPFLTAYDSGRGIVRCSNHNTLRVREVLGSIREVSCGGSPVRVRVETVLTSGSIRKAKRKLGLPPDRRRRRR